MSECTLINLEYTQALLSQYKKLADLPGFVLLHSSDRIRGRYDIVSACPYETLTLQHDENGVDELFMRLQQKLKVTPSSPYNLPFQGGAIGYFSYDLACALAGIAGTSLPGLQEIPLMQLGLYDWAIIADHHEKTVSLFAAHQHVATAELITEVQARWQSPIGGQNIFTVSQAFTPLISHADYCAAFQAIHAELRAGRCYQVNFTQPFQAAFQGDTLGIYERICAENPTPYGAFMRSDTADILSFSPERFITCDSGQLLTSPIKGTAACVEDPTEDARIRHELQHCEKNRAENIMIVDLMRNDFGKIARAGSVQALKLCDIESYRGVHHLVSHITGACTDNSRALDIFSACFPGGSITGAPKLEAMRLISEQETYARGLYCGSIGYFSSHGRFDTNIAIRTVIASRNNLYLSAGGGIVIDSGCDEEYQECFTKTAAITNALNQGRG